MYVYNETLSFMCMDKCILQLCSKLLLGHWPYSVYLYICEWSLAINFTDMPIHSLSLSLSYKTVAIRNT